MGFYIHINVVLHLCEKTGKPFYYGKNVEKIYDLSTLPEVPEKYRRFLSEDGRWLYRYISDRECFEEISGWRDTPLEICKKFPTWEKVECSIRGLGKDYEGYWNEEDHNLLYEAMQWFKSQKPFYQVRWG